VKNKIVVYLPITIISTLFASNLLAVGAPKLHNQNEVEAIHAKALKPPTVKDFHELNIVYGKNAWFYYPSGKNRVEKPC